MTKTRKMAGEKARGKYQKISNLELCFLAIWSSALKILYLNSYHSTDFEVHRNWLAITSSLSLSKWYYEDTSIWTLDYPPFFSWFEYALSCVAYYFDKHMLVITNLNYASQMTILFQRMSVIGGDIILLISLKRFITRSNYLQTSIIGKYFILFATLLNAGLVIVDHIHFQYNGFLFSFLIMSISEMEENHYLQSAFWFTILLNLKHIFLYIAPVYFVFLLRNYCFRPNSKSHTGLSSLLGVNVFDFSVMTTMKLGFVVISIFALSFGPFVYMGQLGQVLSRLFPIKRGLCHAYWAANFWALYNSADKIGAIIGVKLGLLSSTGKVASLTGGLVAEQAFTLFPNIPAWFTAVITVVAMLPGLLKLWYRPTNRSLFLPCLTICAYVSFIFGYHVHEKAILMVIIPLTFLAPQNKHYARVFVVLTISGHYALFPLLHEPRETALKILIFLLYTSCSLLSLKAIHGKASQTVLGIPFVNFYEALYIYGYVFLYCYTLFGHSLLRLDKKLPFLPLMMTSLYCSIGVLWSWLVFYVGYMNSSSIMHEKTKQT